jgi:hypothetical protein
VRNVAQQVGQSADILQDRVFVIRHRGAFLRDGERVANE